MPVTTARAGACAHAIYIENVDLLRVESSHFSNTRQGHSIKSRALRTEVIGCTITDGPDGTSSYLIEAPNGGALIFCVLCELIFRVVKPHGRLGPLRLEWFAPRPRAAYRRDRLSRPFSVPRGDRDDSSWGVLPT